MVEERDVKILSYQMIILIGQVLELKIDLALMRGLTLEEAIERAFEFLESSPLLGELFDANSIAALKEEYGKHVDQQESWKTTMLPAPPIHMLSEQLGALGHEITWEFVGKTCARGACKPCGLWISSEGDKVLYYPMDRAPPAACMST